MSTLSSLSHGVLGMLRKVRRLLFPKKIFVIDTRSDGKARADFYFRDSGVPVEYIGRGSLKPLAYYGPVFVRGEDLANIPIAVRLANKTLDIDELTCPIEAWNWHYGAQYLFGAPSSRAAQTRFESWQRSLPTDLKKTYLFGTGPSLARAVERQWSDGHRIVCNTIVRDPELWHHIDPDAVVAGDALYHFGPAAFAQAFRRDLKARLGESPKTVFIYPAMFDALVRRELSEFTDRLIPIPGGGSSKLHQTISQNFRLPDLGNVLNLLLLPIGCALSKDVAFWGFDGRAPDDKLFWSNSNMHTYADLMGSLQESSPAFFTHMVPKSDPEKYVRSVHGDLLAQMLADAERDGFTFEMLHQTWTPTLQRYVRTAQPVAAP